MFLPLPLRSRTADLDLLRPVRFQALQLDFQDAVVEARLDLVGIDPERQLNRPREAPIGALATLPIGVGLFFWAPRTLQRQQVLLQADRDVVAGYPRQFTGHHNAVLAEPDV